MATPRAKASQALTAAFGRGDPVPLSFLPSREPDRFSPVRETLMRACALAAAVRTSFALLAASLLLASGCVNPLNPRGDNAGPGQRAGDYLRPAPYATILVELDFVSGAEPEAAAVSLLEQRLESATGKPVEVVRTPGMQGLGATHRYTRDDLARLEGTHRSQFSAGTRAVLYMMWLDGSFEDDTDERRVLGAAYRGSAVAMFKANLRFASKATPLDLGKPPIKEVEEAVAVHEVGHILGLVNIGTPMVTPHEDPAHPGHSTNPDSVMYYAVETSVIGSILGQNPPDDFDNNDSADLRAMRNG